MNIAEYYRIVLVEPEDNLNIGAVARAMKNLGFSALHLVAPRNFNIERATITARSAVDILENVIINSTLSEALSSVEEVVGFSSRQGRYRAGYTTLPEWSSTLKSDAPMKTALVFGSEDNGLTHEDMEHCGILVRIPTSQEYAVFNLAQAVLLGIYELSRVHANVATTIPPKELPTVNEYYQLDRIVENVLTTTGFYRDGTPQPIPGLIKNLFRRMHLDKREMGVVMALFSRIDKTLENLLGKLPPSN